MEKAGQRALGFDTSAPNIARMYELQRLITSATEQRRLA